MRGVLNASICVLTLTCKAKAENYICDTHKSQHMFSRMTVRMTSDVAAKEKKTQLAQHYQVSTASVTTWSYLERVRCWRIRYL